jgi:phage pi2 protein 07
MNIASVQVAISFKQQNDILYLLGREIMDFQRRYNVQKQLTNLPEPSPPDIPRLSLFSPNFIVNIALSRMDVFITIPPHVSRDSDASFAYTIKIVEEMYGIFIDKIEYQWLGLVLNIGFSMKDLTKTSLEVMHPVYDAIINIPRKNRELSSFNFNFGFSEYPYYIIYTIGNYETANISFILPNENNIQNKKEIVDMGLSVSLDVNNKQTVDKNTDFFQDFNSIEKKCRSLLASMPDDLNLSAILCKGRMI